MTLTASVPARVRAALQQGHGAPGHVFSLYFPYWEPDNWQKGKDPKEGESAKVQALKKVVAASPSSADVVQALRERQQVLARQKQAVSVSAWSASPFVTGMGEEHAVENGFAFLNPYGVPYLAGSGVKGVIRRAAEELAAGLNPDGEFGWTHARVMWLFGYEDNVEYIEALDAALFADGETAQEANDLLRLLDKNATAFTGLSSDKTHFMGALSFWDVIIDGELGIDILTPHYGHYYQGDEPPHDAGQPVPNPFLVVAPKAKFTFHITCAEHRLPDTLQGDTWRELIRAAFRHAFEWGGFGAKTAVGYGVLADQALLKKQKEQEEQRKREAELRAKEEKKQRQETWVPKVGDRVFYEPEGVEAIIVELADNGDFYVEIDGDKVLTDKNECKLQ